MLRHEHTSGGEGSVMTFRKLEKLIGGTAGHRSQPRGGGRFNAPLPPNKNSKFAVQKNLISSAQTH